MWAAPLRCQMPGEILDHARTVPPRTNRTNPVPTYGPSGWGSIWTMLSTVPGLGCFRGVLSVHIPAMIMSIFCFGIHRHRLAHLRHPASPR